MFFADVNSGMMLAVDAGMLCSAKGLFANVTLLNAFGLFFWSLVW